MGKGIFACGESLARNETSSGGVVVVLMFSRIIWSGR